MQAVEHETSYKMSVFNEKGENHYLKENNDLENQI
jgi:hypothetical protein